MRAFVDAQPDLFGNGGRDFLEGRQRYIIAFARHGQAVADKDHAVDAGLGHPAQLVDLLRHAAGGVSRGDDGHAAIGMIEHEAGQLKRFSLGQKKHLA